MADAGDKKILKGIIYSDGKLSIIDQLLLPDSTKFINIQSTKDGWRVIRDMHVRGAPAIAIVGLLSLAVEIKKLETEQMTIHELKDWICEKLDYLLTSRPTAVNLLNECNSLSKIVDEQMANEKLSKRDLIGKIVLFAEEMLEIDEQTNRSIGDHGAKSILDRQTDESVMINLVTICNTGTLATAAYGTALGIARSLHAQGRLQMLYFLETRPYLQGARLTAYECAYDGLPATMICDSAVAWLMHSIQIHAAVVGLLKWQEGSTPSGKQIKIEHRDSKEMTHARTCDGKPVRITGLSTECWNPAFDVTPAKLVTAYATEMGVFTADLLQTKAQMNWK